MINLDQKPQILYKKHFWTGFSLLLLFYSPYIILGQDSVWYARDYTELVIHLYKLLIEQDAIFKPNDYPINGVLDVLPRGSFPSEFFLKTWIFYFLSTFAAVLINKLLIHLIAYVSAFHFLQHISTDWISGHLFVYALIWACQPFWPEAGIGLAFFPTIFLIFYKLRSGDTLDIKTILLIIGFCFYSHLQLNGVFIISVLVLIGLYDITFTKDFKNWYWISLLALSLTYLIFNYRLLDIYFFERSWFTPHRVEYSIYSFGRYHENLVDKLIQILFFGDVHAVFISPILYFSLLGYLILSYKSNTDKTKRLFLLKLFIGINLVALLAATTTYISFVEKIPFINNINQFSFERFYYLIYPILVFSYILIVNQMLINIRSRKYGWLLISILFLYNILVLDDNYKNKILKPAIQFGEKYPTYSEFYAETQFAKIKRFLDGRSSQDYKVASIGIHPAISSYNGFRAIDGYTGNYPLRYKNDFFEIIQQELGSADMKNSLYWHFKGWGNKAYLFNHTYNDDFMRLKWLEESPAVKPLYNYKKLKAMGCFYILSAYSILDEDNLTLLQKFEDAESAWKIYVYKIL